jgi:Zn-finger nucleic acid-binding protein
MNCPACKNPLQPKNAGADLALDICYGGCGGIWFDSKELERASASAPAATTLHSIWQLSPNNAQSTRVRSCPRCPDQLLERRWFSETKSVEIDQCPQCRGVWLDAEEFSKIYDELKATREISPLWKAAMDVISTHENRPSKVERS